MEEVWKDIEGYEGLYQVSNLGRIKRLARIAKYANGTIHHYEEMIIKPRVNRFGYFYLTLYRNSIKWSARVHKLVAHAFVPNPHNYQCVNHIDENKLNNRADNLEWCSKEYNNTYNNIRQRAGRNIAKSIIAFDNIHKFGTYFRSEADAANYLGKTTCSLISSCANGKRKTAYGYRWEIV